MAFNTQSGAITGGRTGVGWTQSQNIQAGIGSGLQRKQLAESRNQFEQTFAENKRQFEESQAWQKSSFDMTMSAQRRAQKYKEKQDAKANRLGQLNMGISIAELGLNAMNDESILGGGVSNMGKGGGGTAATPQVNNIGMGETAATETAARGGQVGAQGGGGQTWSQQFGGNWGGMFVGGAAGGMAGSFLVQEMFGEGKTQSTIGGAVGGAAGGYYAGGPYGALGGAAVGGILGYLLG